jgi:hypothetical protein
MWFCVDKGSGGGETQYECVLQDPDEDYLSGPFGSKEACEYRCGSQFWCVLTPTSPGGGSPPEYDCVKSNTGAPPNAISGPFGSDAECAVACGACEPIVLPDPPDCPECADAACRSLANGGTDWEECCNGLVETWQFCDGEWVLRIPCHQEGKLSAGTPACSVPDDDYDFPDNPAEGDFYNVMCKSDQDAQDFDTSNLPDCEDCNYACDPVTDACDLDPGGEHKTQQDCTNNCPPKYSCISTDECTKQPNGKYESQAECLEKAPVDCGAESGSCCQYNASMDRYTCIENVYENQCSESGDVFTPGGFCASADGEPCPSTAGAGCVYECITISGSSGATYEDCEADLDFECSQNTGKPCSELGLRYIREPCFEFGPDDVICSVTLACCSGYKPEPGTYECKPAGSDGQTPNIMCKSYGNRFDAEQDSEHGFVCDDPDETGECPNWIRGGDCTTQPCSDVITRSSFAPPP